MENKEHIRNLLMVNGFVDPKQEALDLLVASAEGLVGKGEYATVQDMIQDLSVGGTFLARQDTPLEVIHLVFIAAFGVVPSGIEGDPIAGTELVDWGEA